MAAVWAEASRARCLRLARLRAAFDWEEEDETGFDGVEDGAMSWPLPLALTLSSVDGSDSELVSMDGGLMTVAVAVAVAVAGSDMGGR